MEVVLYLTFSLGATSELHNLEKTLGAKEHLWEEHPAAARLLCDLATRDHSGRRWRERGRSAGEKAHIYSYFYHPCLFSKEGSEMGQPRGFVCKWAANGALRRCRALRRWAGAGGSLGHLCRRVPSVLFRWEMLLLSVGRMRPNFHFASQQQTSTLVCVRWLDLFWLMFARFFYCILK